MLTKNRPDFIYTLEDDEKRCLASIEKIEHNLRDKITTRVRVNGHALPDGKYSPDAERRT